MKILKNIIYNIQDLKSAFKNYKPKAVSKTNILFEEIYNFDTSYDLSKWYIKENSFTNNVELFSKTTHIVDSRNIITVKRHEPKDLKDNAVLIIDMAIAKGWDLDEIEVSGTLEFVESIKNEIEKRKNSSKSNSILDTKPLEENQNDIISDPTKINTNKSVRSSLGL